MKKIFLAILVLLAGFSARAQQSAQFSQYMFNELYINPAYAGYKEVLYAHTSYRAQWVGLEGAPQTFSLGVDGMVKSNLNLGFQVVNDRLGLLGNTSVLGTYAYRVRINKTYRLSYGLSLGCLYSSIDASKLKSDDPDDPVVATGTYSHLSPDAAVGAYFFSDRWYVGLSAQNLIAGSVGNSTKSDYKLPQQRPTLFLSAGFLSFITRDVKIKPSILYKDDFKSPSSIDLNAMVLLLDDRLWVGASYRTGVMLWKGSTYNSQDVSSFQGNTLSLLLEMFVTNRIRVGYSYDYSFTAINAYGSTHEVSLGFYLQPRITKYYSPRYF